MGKIWKDWEGLGRVGKDREGLGSGGELGKLDALCGGTLRKLELTDSMPSVGSTPGSGDKSHAGQTIPLSCPLFPVVSMVPPLSERSEKCFSITTDAGGLIHHQWRWRQRSKAASIQLT